MEAEDIPNTLLAKTSTKTTTSNKNSPSKRQKKNNGNNGKGQNKNKNKNKDRQDPSKIKGPNKQNASSHECHNKASKNKSKDKVYTNLQVVQAKVQESSLKAIRKLEAKKRAMEKVKNYWKDYQAKTKEQQSQKSNKIKTLSTQLPKIPQQEKTKEPQLTGPRQRKLSHKQHRVQDQQGILNSERSSSSEGLIQVPPQPQPRINQQSLNNSVFQFFYRSQIAEEDLLAQNQQIMCSQQQDIIFRGRITTNNRTEAIQVDNTQNHPPLVLRPKDESNNAQIFTIQYYGDETAWIRNRDGLTLQVTGNPPRIQLRDSQENEASKFKIKKHIFQSYSSDRIQCRKWIYYQDYFLAFDDQGPAREVRLYQHVPQGSTSLEQPRIPVLWRFQVLNDQ